MRAAELEIERARERAEFELRIERPGVKLFCLELKNVPRAYSMYVSAFVCMHAMRYIACDSDLQLAACVKRQERGRGVSCPPDKAQLFLLPIELSTLACFGSLISYKYCLFHVEF